MAILLREVWKGDTWTVRPVVVVRDDDDLIALFMPSGTPWLRPVDAGGEPMRMPIREWTLVRQMWRNDVLFLSPPGAAHSVWAMWTDDHAEFRGWYVNLQEPMRRTSRGFDYMDQELDIVIGPDLSWRWKDQDDQAEAVRLGLRSPEDAAVVRAEGERIIRRVESGGSPFGDGWERWLPDPAWPRPGLPPEAALEPFE